MATASADEIHNQVQTKVKSDNLSGEVALLKNRDIIGKRKREA
jgi:hypothetical protein